MSRDVKYMDTVGKLLDIVYGHWVLLLISILGRIYNEHWRGRPQFSLYPLSISSTEQTTLLYVHIFYFNAGHGTTYTSDHRRSRPRAHAGHDRRVAQHAGAEGDYVEERDEEAVRAHATTLLI